MVVIHVAAVRVAIMPVFKTLDGVCCRSIGSGSATAAAEAAAVVAAAAVEAAATATAAAVAAAAAVATAATIVASAASAVIVSAAAVAIPIEDLGATVARSAATASLASSAVAGRARTLLLVIGHHVGGGMGSKCLAEHLNLPLHGIDGLVASALALLCGRVCCPKVGYSIREGGAVVFGGRHAVAVRAGWGSVKDAIFTASAQKARKAVKLFVFMASSLRRIQVLYSSEKRPVRWRTRMPMLTILPLLMGYFGRFAKVAPRNRRATSSSKPMDGCHSDATTVRFALRSSANVRPYLKTNQSNILREMALGSSILFCSYACLKATGIRSRNASMSAAFMLTM